MYLALIPDAESIRNLKWVAPQLPDDVHLTVIHSKEPKRELPTWQSGSPLVVPCVAFDVFGGKSKVKVLKLALVSELSALRQAAEQLFQIEGVSWSNEWTFSPHITLGPLNAEYRAIFPPSLTFDRMEWR